MLAVGEPYLREYAEKAGMDMEKHRILIADMDEGFCRELAKAFPAQFTVTMCGSGTEALTVANRETPDVMLVNMQLPGLDGIGLLEALEQAGIHAERFFITRMFSPYMARKAQALGVSFVFVMPCTAEEIAHRIVDAVEEGSGAVSLSQNCRQWVPDTLTELSVAVKLKGFAYLNEAIPYLAAHPGASITKELYPAIAVQYATTGMLVERSIRTAIDGAWKHRNEAAWRRYFPADAGETIPRPTNATFISCLARHLTERFPDAARPV